MGPGQRCPCSGKVCHPYRRAQLIAKRGRRRYDGSALNCWRCRCCSFWHVGHMPEGSPRGWRRKAR